jgi:hypothetical protein
VREWCEENKKECFVKETKFVDFGTSRNEALAFADSAARADYYLLLDANDELSGDPTAWFEESPNTDGFMARVQLTGAERALDFFSVRVIKARRGWKYVGSVHEYLSLSNAAIARLPKDVHIVQNRDNDGNKSAARYERDYKALLQEVHQLPTAQCARALFYLARTCHSLGRADEAIKYYTFRAGMQDTFEEERFWSYIGLARITANPYYLIAAYELRQRAEPLIDLAKIYTQKRMFRIAHMFAAQACELEFPTGDISFVDATLYEKDRWEILKILKELL